MPQAAAASRTPAIGGRSGKRVGASGERSGMLSSSRASRRERSAGRPPRRTGGGLFLLWLGAALLLVSFGLGRAVRVEARDCGLPAQVVDDFRDHVAARLALELVLLLLEGRRGGLAHLLDLDHVPAELGLDRRLRVLTHLEREGGIRELGHHVAALDEAEIAAFGRGGTARALLRELGEIGPALELLDHRLGLVLAFHENVAGM